MAARRKGKTRRRNLFLGMEGGGSGVDVKGEYLGNNMEGGAGSGFSGGGWTGFEEDAFGPFSCCFFDLPVTMKRGYYLHGHERKRKIRKRNRGIDGGYLCETCEERTGEFETAAASRKFDAFSSSSSASTTNTPLSGLLTGRIFLLRNPTRLRLILFFIFPCCFFYF